MVAVFLLVFPISVLLGLFYHQIFDRETPVRIIAHRAGGIMASENSIEGLYAAMEHGCYASEIDVQRTKDGHYIIITMTATSNVSPARRKHRRICPWRKSGRCG